MCSVSFITDHYKDKWTAPMPSYYPTGIGPIPTSTVTKYEFEALRVLVEQNQKLFEELKKEFLDVKELLKKAKVYDEVNGEPECEMADKVDFMRKMAGMLGVTIDDVFPK